MSEDVELVEKRQELKRQIASGECKLLPTVILDGTGHLVQKLTRSPEPPPLWYNVVVIALATWAIGLLTAILFGENSETMPRYVNPGFLLRKGLLTGYFLVAVVAGKVLWDIVLAACRDWFLDAVETARDLADLERSLAAACDTKKSLLFTITLSIIVYLYLTVRAMTRGTFSGFGNAVVNVITDFQMVMCAYYLYLSAALGVRFGRYQLKLYKVDPAHSEVIDRLSDLYSGALYVVAAFAAAGTLYAALFGGLTWTGITMLVLGGWGPLIGGFVLGQYNLNRIITRAKWKTLKEVQAKIEALHAKEDPPSQCTLKHIRALIDYHDLIRATRTSTLDLRAVLNLLNSLLLPVIASLLGNINSILALFE
jgi:hypothetical protein